MKRFLVLSIVACGGHVVEIDDASTDSSVDAPKDVIVVDVPVTVDCKALEAELAAQRAQILVCCPFCNSAQCNHVTKDVCCPISTTAMNVAAFEALVQQYITQCKPACPATPCPAVPSNTCVPGATMNDPGTCK